VQLDRLAVQLRLRNPWEAIDLGFAMVRVWFKPVYAAWLAVFVPVCAVALLLLPPHWAWFAVWWLKPALDRVVLHVLSNAVFGETPTLRQTLRALPQALRPGLLWSLTLYRFDFARSFNIPIWQLERQGWRAARARARQLHRRTRQYAVWLTVACVHIEAVMWLSAVGLYDLLVPASTESEAGFLSLLQADLPEGFRQGLFAALSFLATTIVEPCFVAGGFALYLNRRTALEGWDLEVQLRRIGERLQAAQRALAGVAMCVALTLAALVLSVPAPVLAQPASATRLAPDSRAAREVKAVLGRPEFQEYEERTVLRYLGKSQERKVESGSDSFWGQTLSVGLAELLRGLAWVLLGLAVAFLFYLLLRRLDLLALWRRRQRSAYLPPDTLFGLDVRPVSLPDDVAAAALKLAQAGQLLKALSLLYRGALVALLHRDGLELARGDTEEDCLRKTHERIPQAAHAYFAHLLLSWQRLAYAGRSLPAAEVEQLCTDWRTHFATAVRPTVEAAT
jgi:hypothetical protein